VQALVGVDLDVKAGEVLAVLGPNGAGKTTLVEILEGLRHRNGGIAVVLGADPADAARDWRARIGAVLQVSTQNDELTVGEMITAYAGYYPHPLDIEHLLEALDLTAIRDRRVHQLSGGQRRRLDLALGLVGDPELLFLDEPTTGLDPEVRIRIWEFIEGLAEQGTTILLTTHYMEEAETLADRVAVLVGGRIVTTGPPDDLGGSGGVHVSFRLTEPLLTVPLPDALPPLVVRDKDHIEVTTDDPTDVVTRFVLWADGYGGKLADLEIQQRGLEQFYLELLDHLNDREGAAV
jgi:ABC-2 type transport system ATP-binding protein